MDVVTAVVIVGIGVIIVIAVDLGLEEAVFVVGVNLESIQGPNGICIP